MCRNNREYERSLRGCKLSSKCICHLALVKIIIYTSFKRPSNNPAGAITYRPYSDTPRTLTTTCVISYWSWFFIFKRKDFFGFSFYLCEPELNQWQIPCYLWNCSVFWLGDLSTRTFPSTLFLTEVPTRNSRWNSVYWTLWHVPQLTSAHI